MSRIVLDLEPLQSLDVQIAVGRMTREQFLAFIKNNPDLRAERSATGEVIAMPPASSRTCQQNFELNRQLGNWADADDTGLGFGPDSGYDLPNGATRGPDASWVLKTRIAALTNEQRKVFFPLAPDFAVELRSPSDRLTSVREKMQEYIENGVRLAWLIDPKRRRVYVYRPGSEEQVMENPATVSGDPELPGFTLDLARIWDPGF